MVAVLLCGVSFTSFAKNKTQMQKPDTVPTISLASRLIDRGGFALLPAPIDPPVNNLLPTHIPQPEWVVNAVSPKLDSDKPLIAIVIDDMGLNRPMSARAAALPVHTTLAWLPYADDLPEQVDIARANGHEMLVHMPMEPESDFVNPGPHYLGSTLPAADIKRRIRKNLSAFDGFVGVNNHMGSKFTKTSKAVQILMEELAKRNLLFLDSRTSPQSVAEKLARENSIATTHRDVFLDHSEDPAFVKGALEKVLTHARKHGSAVAIGHPKAVTLEALEQWIPQAQAEGFQFVPITTVIRYRENLVSPAPLTVASTR